MQNDKQGKTSPLTLAVDTMLNERYEILGVIGIGGFGITYKGYDIYNQSLCAIKELFVNNFAYREPDGITVTPFEGKEKIFEHSIDNFMDEAGTLKALNGTPNVVKITDYFKENGTAYFTMEYIEGFTLRSMMQNNGGKLPYDDVLRIITIAGTQLDYIHKKHYIFHRDISPENIMIAQNGEPKWIDFGNAKNYMRCSEQGLSVILKPGFAPIEQYSGKDQGPWTDVYSLAAVFYLAASGERVPPSTARLNDGETYTPLCDLVPECTKEVSDAVDRALAMDPKERTQSIKEFVSALGYSSKSNKPIINSNKPKKLKAVEKWPYITIFEYGRQTGRWRLPGESQIILGRDGRYSNIVVGEFDTTISKQHCVISFDKEQGAFVVTDISTNGTFWRNTRLKKQQSTYLKPGERITFGSDRYIIVMGVEV